MKKPRTFKQFIRVFKSLQNIYKPFQWITPPQYSFQRFIEYYRPPSVTYHQPRYQYNQRKRLQKPHYPYGRIRFQQLCTHHKSLCVRCNHTDAQCRDPAHPKCRTNKPQANYLLARLSSLKSQQPYPAHQSPCTLYLPFFYQTFQASPPPYEAGEADTEYKYKFVLDSGAHPTHIPMPRATMTPLQQLTLTQLATNE